MQLILNTKGIIIKQRNGCFHLQTEQHERLVGPQKVSSIVITSHCMLTTSAIKLAIQERIPIYFVDAFGRVEGQLWSASFGHLATLRRNQVYFDKTSDASNWIIDLFQIKTKQQVLNLAYLANRKIALEKTLNKALDLLEGTLLDFENYKDRPLDDVSESLMGIEGNAAKCYWQALAECMPVEFRFENRNRHPANDAFNAAINYLYGMLYTIVETAIFSVGLDPYLGIMHADQYNKPTLSYDLIEPFRPWADRVVIEGILQDEVKQSFFEKKEDAVILSKLGKQYFIPKFNLFMASVGEFQHTKTIRKNHVYRQVGELVDILNEKYK